VVSLHESPAQIAARYGAVVRPGVTVQQIPRGTSAYSLPVWTGNTLEYPDADQRGWRAEAAAGRKRAAQLRRDNPAIIARREQVAGLHAQGLITAEIVAATGLPAYVVSGDLRALGLQPHCAVARRRLTLETSFRALVAQGHGERDLIDLLGVPLRRLRSLAAQTGTVLPREIAAPPRRSTDQKSARAEADRIRRQSTPEATARRARLAAKAQARADRKAAHLARRDRLARQDAAYRALHAQGVTLADAAAQLGTTMRALRQRRLKLGLPPSTGDIAHARQGKRARLDLVRPAAGAARQEQALQMHRAGATAEAISTATGLGVTWVIRFIRATGGRALRETDRLRADRQTAIRAMVAAGRPINDIAKALDMTRGALKSFARRSGLDLHGAASGPRFPSLAARQARAAQLRAEGKTLAQIGAALGISLSTASSDLRAAGASGKSLYASRPSLPETRPELVAVVRHGLAQGHSLAAIARALNIPAHAVRRLRDAGGSAGGTAERVAA
jgi:DNA-binding CsgD family transcriptional regulator